MGIDLVSSFPFPWVTFILYIPSQQGTEALVSANVLWHVVVCHVSVII